MATMQVSTPVGNFAIACCRSLVNVAIPQRRGGELPMKATRSHAVTLVPLRLHSWALWLAEDGSNPGRPQEDQFPRRRACGAGLGLGRNPHKPRDPSALLFQPRCACGPPP